MEIRVSFKKAFELRFENTEFPGQTRAGKAFPIAGIACKVRRRNGAFRKSSTVVQVKGIADKAEEEGRSLAVKSSDCHNTDFILQMSGHQRTLGRGCTGSYLHF